MQRDNAELAAARARLEQAMPSIAAQQAELAAQIAAPHTISEAVARLEEGSRDLSRHSRHDLPAGDRAAACRGLPAGAAVEHIVPEAGRRRAARRAAGQRACRGRGRGDRQPRRGARLRARQAIGEVTKK